MEHKRKIHLIGTIGVILVVMVYLYLIAARENSRIDEKVHYEEYQIAKTYEHEKDKTRTLYTNFLKVQMDDALFIKHYKAHDYAQVQSYFKPLFEQLQLTDNNIRGLKLYDKNGITRFTIGMPKDPKNITRPSTRAIQKVLKNTQPLSGFALYPEGFYYSTVYPVTLEGRTDGAVELLIDPKKFTTLFETILEAQTTIFLSSDYIKNNRTHVTGKTFVNGSLLDKHIGDLGTLPETFDLAQDNQEITIGKTRYHLHSEQAILGHLGEKLGSFIILFDRTRERQQLYTYLTLALVLTLVLVGAIGFFSNYLINAIIRKIHDKQKNIETLNQTLVQIAEDKTRELDKNLSLLQSYKKAVDYSNIVSKTDPKGIITYVNKEFIRVSGYTKKELLGRPHNIIRHPDMPSETYRELWNTIRAKKVWKGIIKNRKKDGGFYIVDTIITPVVDAGGEISEYIAIRHDVTDLTRQREELREIKTDALTGFANKNALKDILVKHTPHMLAILNIDNFKEVKDFYGVDAIDGVIATVAEKIKKYFAPKGYGLYKITTEQFAVYSPDVEAQARFTDEINAFIVKCSSEPVFYNFYEVYLDFTAGIAFDENGELLFKNADLALKEARYKHLDSYVYNAQIDLLKEYEKNIHWTAKLKKAITTEQLVAFYQPIVNNTTMQFEKYESLIRMIDEDGSVITPFFFLDMAKRSKLYSHITHTVIASSVEAFKENGREFSINITAEDIHNDETVRYLENSLLEHNIATRCVLEITESEEIKDYRKVVRFIKQFKEYGCKIAIDDFGSGYSNFNYIADLDADYIKIDGSLIKNIDKDETSRLIVKTIITFAQHMGIKTIAEFVSSKEIFDTVKAMGIDYSQGYYFAPPGERVVLETEVSVG